jgi:hypothetical protein
MSCRFVLFLQSKMASGFETDFAKKCEIWLGSFWQFFGFLLKFGRF